MEIVSLVAVCTVWTVFWVWPPRWCFLYVSMIISAYITESFFDVLLTELHLSIFISVFNQLDAQNFCFRISFISCLYIFRAYVLIIRRSKLHYTASGIITPIGGRLVHRLREISYRCDDTRGCVMQFWPPDDEHMCWKHVEARNKLIVKQTFCASSWLISITQMYVSTIYLFCSMATCFD